MNFSSSPSLSGTDSGEQYDLDHRFTTPMRPDTPINVPFTGTLAGNSNIVLQNATGTTSRMEPGVSSTRRTLPRFQGSHAFP
jgi:hypothetical protein